jgi:hypothetical protein
MMLKQYGRYVGIIFFIFGAVGIVLHHFFGLFDLELPQSLLYLLIGAWGIYAGNFWKSEKQLKTFAQVAGLFFLLWGLVGIFRPTLGSVSTETFENLLHLVSGGAGVYLGFIRPS